MSRQLAGLILTSVLLVAVVIGCKPRGVIEISRQQPIRSINMLRRYNGNDSGFKNPVVKLINSEQELKSLGSDDLINYFIDFDRESVILFALGEKSTGGYWARITGLQRDSDWLYVQGRANKPDISQITTPMLTYPYDAVIVKKIYSATIRTEIDSVSGQNPEDIPTQSQKNSSAQ